jgi:hypothetical protein
MPTGSVQALVEVSGIAEAGAGREQVIACGAWAADLAASEFSDRAEFGSAETLDSGEWSHREELQITAQE